MHTHRGHCQACGRLQAVTDSGKLAHHGYTVQWGMFNGTCSGARRLPLEQERTLCDDITTQVNAFAWRTETHANNVRRGLAFPLQCVIGQHQNPEWKPGAAMRKVARWVDTVVDWADATGEQRSKELHRTLTGLDSQASAARAHAIELQRLAATYHGQPLVAVDAKAKPRAVNVGDVFTVYGREWRVRSMVSRGFSGRSNTHCICERTDGATLTDAAIRAAINNGQRVDVGQRPLTIATRQVRAALGDA